MAINIGDNNKIQRSTISENSKIENKEQKNRAEKHPVIVGIIIAVVSGIILKFTIWDEIVCFINQLLR